MEKITSLSELAEYLFANIDKEALARNDDSYESGYANANANLLYILSPSFRDAMKEILEASAGTKQSDE